MSVTLFSPSIVPSSSSSPRTSRRCSSSNSPSIALLASPSSRDAMSSRRRCSRRRSSTSVTPSQASPGGRTRASLSVQAWSMEPRISRNTRLIWLRERQGGRRAAQPRVAALDDRPRHLPPPVPPRQPPRATLPPASYPWDRFDRRDEVWALEQALADLRGERRRAVLLLWLRRVLTLGLAGGSRLDFDVSSETASGSGGLENLLGMPGKAPSGPNGVRQLARGSLQTGPGPCAAGELS